MAKTEIGEIYYRITGDNSGLKNTLNESDQGANKLVGTLMNVGKAIAGAFIVKQIFDVGKAIIGVASDANETSSKFGVVFSSISDRANQTASDISEGYGMSRNAAKEYLSGVGDILKGLEFTQSASLDTSSSIVKLSADLVSFKNYAGGVEGATHAITSALLGERESLKGLGIAISDADLKQFAADSGLVWDNLDRQHQATLTLALITERAGNAIGDFERTQYGFANQTRIAEGNINNLEVTLGTKLLPAATLGVIAFNEIVKSLDKSAMGLGDWMSSAEGASQVANFLGSAIGNISGVLTALEPIVSGLGDGFMIIWDALSAGLGDIGGATEGFTTFAIVSTVLSDALRITATSIGGVITLVVDLGLAFWETGKALAYFAGFIAGGISWDELKDQVSKSGAAITKLGEDTINSVNKIIGETGKAINSLGADIDKTNQKASASADKMAKGITTAVNKALTATQQSNTEQANSHEDMEKSKTGLTLAQSKERDKIEKQSAKDRDKARKDEAKAEEEKLKTINEVAGKLMSGLNDLMSGISANIQGDLQQTLDWIDTTTTERLASLDAQMAAELEAAGLTEQTERERIQSQLDAAIEAGDTETAAKLQDDLDRLDIQQKYADRKAGIEAEAANQKAQAEYNAAHKIWEMQVVKSFADMALGIMQATIAGMQFGPGAAAMVPILVAIASAAGVANIAATADAEPTSPTFATGGIVPGSSFSGDKIIAKVNSGEMVLNTQQQAQLFNMANGNNGGGNYFTFMIDSETLYDKFYTDSKNGKFRIHKRGVVAL